MFSSALSARRFDVTAGEGALNTGVTDETQENKRNWVLLHAPASGTYRISAPYKLPRGSSCS